MVYASIGDFLKTIRKEQQLSVQDVVDSLSGYEVNISKKTLYGWENGHRQPDADTFIVLCKILNVSKFPSIGNINQPDSNLSSEAMKIAYMFDASPESIKAVVRAALAVLERTMERVDETAYRTMRS